MKDATSIGIIATVIIIDIILFVIFGLIGSDLAAADTTFNDEGLVSADYNDSSFSITQRPSFMQGFVFTLSTLPGWLNGLLLIPQALIIIAGVYWLRGSS